MKSVYETIRYKQLMRFPQEVLDWQYKNLETYAKARAHQIQCHEHHARAIVTQLKAEVSNEER